MKIEYIISPKLMLLEILSLPKKAGLVGLGS